MKGYCEMNRKILKSIPGTRFGARYFFDVTSAQIGDDD